MIIHRILTIAVLVLFALKYTIRPIIDMMLKEDKERN